MYTEPNHNEPDRPDQFRGPLTFAEMSAGLVWPSILRSGVMALQPPRLLLAFALVVLLGIASVVYDGVLGLVGLEPVAQTVLEHIARGLEQFADSLLALEPVLALELLYQGVFAQNLALLGERPLTTGLFLLVLTPLWAVFGGAIARMVAVDVAGHLYMTSGDGLVFASRRMPAMSFSLYLPLIVLGVLVLAIALLGTVLLGVPVLNAVGGVLYGIVLVLGILLGLVFVGFVVGQALLVPAISCESSDAADAVQRAYAYIFNRPGRSVLYIALALVQGVVLFAVARWFVTSFAGATLDLATSWIGSGPITPADEGEDPLVLRASRGWERIFSLLVPAVVVSHYFSASTLVYLVLRRVNDGQDLRELWMPGFVGGALAPAQAPGRRPETGEPGQAEA